MTYWWQQAPSRRVGYSPGFNLPNGAADIEKGDIYSISAGTELSLPVPARIAWEDNQHVVLVTTQGVLSFLHVNPTKPVGSLIGTGKPFGKVSDVGSSGHSGSYYDSTSGVTYVESGNIVEFGSYDTADRAASRDNYVNGVDRPTDFTGIFDPSKITSLWKSGNKPQKAPPEVKTTFVGTPARNILTIMGMNPIVIIVAIVVALILLRKL